MGTNGKNLDDLNQMDGKIVSCFTILTRISLEFVHTSDLESVNSLILKYSSKKDSYG